MYCRTLLGKIINKKWSEVVLRKYFCLKLVPSIIIILGTQPKKTKIMCEIVNICQAYQDIFLIHCEHVSSISSFLDEEGKV